MYGGPGKKIIRKNSRQRVIFREKITEKDNFAKLGNRKFVGSF